MKSYNVHTTTNKYSKRKQRRYNALKSTITVSRDKIPPQIFSTPNKIQYYENVKLKPIKQDYQIVSSNDRLKTNYLQDFNPVYFSTRQAKLLDVKLCSETMTLLPFKNQHGQNVINRKNIGDKSSLARLTMSALAASETDINSILELVETMYQSIHDMLRDIKLKQKMYNPAETIEPERTEKPKYVIKIHLKKFMNYLNEQYIRFNSNNVPQNQITNGSESLPVPINGSESLPIPIRLPYCKQPSTSYLNNQCRSFNILLQPRRMSFNITVCKFNSCSMDFFQRLAKFYNSCNLTCSKRRKPVPSVFIRDWHFRNASQGYLLSVLLKHNNVMSLNVMRKLYFVIITSVTPNLTIEINFKLANGIFMAYDSTLYDKLPCEVIHFNDGHRNILETSKICSPYFTYNTPHMAADFNNDPLRDATSDITLHTNRSSDSSSTLKNESSSEYDGSDYFIKSTSYSQTGFFDLKNAASSTNLTIRESVKTLTLSIDDIQSCNVLLNTRKDCGDMNFATTFQEQSNMYNSRIQQSRTWISKVYRESSNFNAELIMPYLNSVMNETVFDRVSGSIGDCFSTFNQYWSQMRSQTFCKIVLKDLGNYLLKSLLISLVYH